MREKLDTDGNRLQSELAKYAEFSETVMQLTKIVADGMTHDQGASPKINRTDLADLRALLTRDT